MRSHVGKLETTAEQGMSSCWDAVADMGSLHEGNFEVADAGMDPWSIRDLAKFEDQALSCFAHLDIAAVDLVISCFARTAAAVDNLAPRCLNFLERTGCSLDPSLRTSANPRAAADEDP